MKDLDIKKSNSDDAAATKSESDATDDQAADIARYRNALQIIFKFLLNCILFLFSAADASLLQKIIRKGLVESKLDIEVQRKDPDSPLYSVQTFEALRL